MKKLIALSALICIVFSACLKDDVSERYVIYRPVYRSKAEVMSSIKSDAPSPLHNTGKLFLKDKIAYINEVNEGVHLVDYSNPSNPINKHFIQIPGNVDIAVRGNYLYADCYTYLAVIDITNPANVKLVKMVANVFPNRAISQLPSPDTSLMIVGWKQKDTVINRELTENVIRNINTGGGLIFSASSSYSAVPSSKSATGAGVAGSMSRFALVNDRMYAVTNSQIRVFNILNPADPMFVKDANVFSSEVETIFPYNDKLFIGTTTGMFIYSITDQDNPKYISGFSHSRGCDPVITDGDYAYVTIRSGSVCGGVLNQMDVLNIKNLPVVQLVKSYPFKAPQGLSKDGNLLFLCDGADGVKILNAANVNSITQVTQLKDVDAFDVIAEGGLAVVTAKGALIFIDYSDVNNITIKGKLSIN